MAAQPTCGRRQQRQRAGFSLVELMTVVIIVGILSAIAIPTFSAYVYKARAAEATQFIGVIKLRQEAYRAEFGGYCAVSGTQTSAFTTDANFMPDISQTPTMPTGQVWTPYDPRPFTNANAGIVTAWNQLGARPGGYVRFGYAVIAGPPTALPLDGSGTSFGYELNPDFWFIVQALGDLDADGNRVTFEAYSASKGIWVGGSDNAGSKGWE